MRISVGSLPVDVMPAEAARFRHPLLLVHGLWTGSWVWRGFMAYLAHRGWESWAPSFLEDERAYEPGDRVQQLVDVAKQMPAAPVVIGHDAGAILAAVLAPIVSAPAVVVLAPLLAGRSSLLRWPRFWVARRFGRRLDPPRAHDLRTLIGGATEALRPDSASFFRAVIAETLRFPAASSGPGLVVCSSEDPISPPAAGEDLARRLAWSYREFPPGPAGPMLGPGWERLADELHRWLVRSLGERLLAWLDDDEGQE